LSTLASRLRLRAILAALVVLFAAWPALAGSVSGRVLDAAGKPVAGAAGKWFAYRTDDQVLLDQTSGTEPAPLGETKTGEDGRFRVALSADKSGASFALRITPGGAPSLRLAGPYEASEDSSLDDLHVSAAEPLTGRVVDDQGKPVGGATVIAIATDPFSDVDAQSLSEAKSGVDGSFSIPNAPGAPRGILVRAPGYVPANQFQLEPRLDQRVTVKRGGSMVLTSPITKSLPSVPDIPPAAPCPPGPAGPVRMANCPEATITAVVPFPSG